MIGWSREIDELGWSTWEPPAADGPDLERVRDQLAREMARSHGHGWNLVDVRIGKRRQSRRGMTALYTLVFDGSAAEHVGAVEHAGKVGENGTDGQIEQVYVGCELSPGALDTAYTSALAGAAIPPAVGPAVVRVPEANLLLVAFPNDSQLRVPSDDALHTCVARVVNRMAGRARAGRRQLQRVEDGSFTVLRYIPGRRLTLRCRGQFTAESTVAEPFAFIAKQFKDPSVARALHHNLMALNRNFRDSGAVRLPRPVAFDSETGLVFMEELPGTDLVRALGDVDIIDAMSAVGRMLAAFHQSRLRFGATISLREKINDLCGVASKIERLFPTAMPRLSACLARCLTTRWSDDVPDVLLHGAFRPKHVFVHDGRPALIDLDGMRVGHPAHDVGHFLSALCYHEAQDLMSDADRRVAVNRFLEGYCAAAPWRLQPAAVLWCTAALLVNKQARKYVVHLHRDRERKVDRVLTLAERALAACERLRPGTQLDIVGEILG